MKQLIRNFLGMQPRKMPLQTRSVQLRIKYKTTIAKKQSKLWAFAQNASALVTLGQLFKDLLVSLLANL